MSSFEVSPDRIVSPPYAFVGLALAYLADGHVQQGTFALVGRNDFLTATHLVIDPSTGQPVRRIDFFLGVDFNRTYGSFSGSTGMRLAGSMEYMPHPVISWTPASGTLLSFPADFNQDGLLSTLTDAEAQHDLALVGVDQAIGDRLGWLRMNPLIVDVSDALSIGYPQHATGMMTRPVAAELSRRHGIFTTENGALRPGDSGGPLLVNGDLVGVASGGTEDRAIWAAVASRFGEIEEELARNDSLLGGAADDRRAMVFDFSSAATSAAQWLQGFGGDEVLAGGGGNDTLMGAGGNDTLFGGTGSDFLSGGDGDDVLDGGSSSDGLDGGTGRDLVMFSGAAAGVRVDLSGKKPSARSLSKDKALVGTDTLTSIEDVMGTGFGDSIKGDGAANYLVGLAGNDTLSGGAGHDTIDGGAGADLITGGAGADCFMLSTLPTGSKDFDTLNDFVAREDRIALSRQAFSVLAGVSLAEPSSWLFLKGRDLMYDADGAGAQQAVPLVRLVGKTQEMAGLGLYLF